MVQRDTRRALLDAAAEVIALRGVEAASTREIYLRAGVKAPTLYHHFGDKQGLLDAVVTDAFDRYLASKRALHRTPGDPAAMARQGWDQHVAFARANPSLYQLMWPPGPGALPPAAAESARELREGFARLARQGYLRPGVTPGHAARVLSAALHGVTAAITRDPGNRGNARLSATVREAVIDALVAPLASRGADQPDPASPDPASKKEE